MNSLDKFLLFVALPSVILASLLEALVLARRRGYDWRAAAVSLLDLIARVGVQIFLPLSIATPRIVLAPATAAMARDPSVPATLG